MRILYITDSFPYPPVSGDRIRTYNLLRRVAAKHEVWLAALLGTPDEVGGLAHMQGFCVGVEVANPERRRPLAHLTGLLPYALTGKPLELKFQHSEELLGKIRHSVPPNGFDIVQIVHSHMALYLEALPPDACHKWILEFHNIAFDQFDRILRIEHRLVRRMRVLINALMMRRWEPRYAEHFDRCIVVSEADRSLLLGANPRLLVDVIPNGVDTKLYQALPQETSRPILLFTGKMSYPPCTDAAMYFSREVLPRIRNLISNIEVWFVGREPPPEVLRLHGDGVHVTGRVEDVVPYYRQCAVFIVPLRAGGGTRLKILEAMALGRPVVSTAIGCEGLDVIGDEHLLIADSAEQFAEKTVRLLTDVALYRKLAFNARQLVVRRYDWDIIAGELMRVYEETAL